MVDCATFSSGAVVLLMVVVIEVVVIEVVMVTHPSS